MNDLTTKELRTLVWMCQNEGARVAARAHHKNLEENETYQRVLSIGKKAYWELINRNDLE